MSDFHGKFVWYELMTTDTAEAKDFYRKVVGWSAQDAPMPGGAYTMLTAGEVPIGGMMTLSENACAEGARPGWIGYVAVDDVDTRSSQVEQDGGAVLRAPDDIPGIGRFAIVSDPQGAAMALFRGEDGSQAPEEPPCGSGRAGWHELHAADWEKAFAFYSGLLGWNKADAIDMGPMGTYQLFAKGSDPMGGMMNKMDGLPAPFWLYYFAVDGIDGAKQRVEESGGRVLHGPQEVPGGAWILQALDPQGAMFALVGPRG